MIVEGIIKDLIECLQSEEAHYSRLVQLAQKQKEILIAGQEEALMANIKLQEKEVFGLGPLRAKREDLLKKWALGSGLKKFGLADALKVCPRPWQDELKKGAAELVQTVKRLDELNRGNGKLLGNAADLAKFTLRAIQSGGNKRSLERMTEGKAERRSSFVNRVI